MNREIKFRGKRIDCNEWVHGQLIHYKSGAIRIVENRHERIYNVIPESVGQFTGLLDKNGKEIYEADILKHPQSICYFVVIFDTGQFRLQGQDKYLLKNKVTASILHYEFCEVIGNIYENPELIAYAQ